MAKRKLENCVFKTEWEIEFFVIENINERPQCLICNKIIGTMKRFNIDRHYRSIHQALYGSITGEARLTALSNLKVVFFNTEKERTSPSDSNLVRGSFECSYIITKAKKCLSDGELMKEVFKAALNNMGQEGKKLIPQVDKLPLSRRTVTRRAEDLNVYLRGKVFDSVRRCKYFSICLDESTDVKNISQLLIFVRMIHSNFEIEEQMLNIIPLHGTTKGIDVFEATKQVIEEVGGFTKMSGVCTDGAPSMRGIKEGFVGQLRKYTSVDIQTYHCIIHQEALASRAINLTETMQVVVQVVNKIKGGHNALTHRKFTSFLSEMDAEYGDLLLYTEVRWLSRGKCLERFFALRKEVVEFLKAELQNSNFVQTLERLSFLCSLAFLTDVTHYLNILNSFLQGKNKNIFEMIGHIDSFKNKLTFLRTRLLNNDLSDFYPSCATIQKEFPEANFLVFEKPLNSLILEFGARFQDFENIKLYSNFFYRPLTCPKDSLLPNVQMELFDFQEDPYLQSLDKNLPPLTFWQHVSAEKYPFISDQIFKLASLFSSSYMCETTFSTMKIIKSKNRNKLTDAHLECLLRIAVTDIPINFHNPSAPTNLCW